MIQTRSPPSKDDSNMKYRGRKKTKQAWTAHTTICVMKKNLKIALSLRCAGCWKARCSQRCTPILPQTSVTIMRVVLIAIWHASRCIFPTSATQHIPMLVGGVSTSHEEVNHAPTRITLLLLYSECFWYLHPLSTTLCLDRFLVGTSGLPRVQWNCDLLGLWLRPLIVSKEKTIVIYILMLNTNLSELMYQIMEHICI